MGGSLSGTETDDQSLYRFPKYETRNGKMILNVIRASKCLTAYERNVALVGGRAVRCLSF